MPENVSDRFERCADSEQMNRKRVTKTMRALERNAQSAMADEGLKRLRDGGRLK